MIGCAMDLRILTGIGNSSLTTARDSVMRHKQSSCARSELSQWLDIVATSKPKLYLDSRQWLEWYADTHAEKSDFVGVLLARWSQVILPSDLRARSP